MKTPRPAHQPELFDTADAFMLVSPDGVDGHMLLALEEAKRDAARRNARAQRLLEFEAKPPPDT